MLMGNPNHAIKKLLFIYLAGFALCPTQSGTPVGKLSLYREEKHDTHTHNLVGCLLDDASLTVTPMWGPLLCHSWWFPRAHLRWMVSFLGPATDFEPVQASPNFGSEAINFWLLIFARLMCRSWKMSTYKNQGMYGNEKVSMWIRGKILHLFLKLNCLLHVTYPSNENPGCAIECI